MPRGGCVRSHVSPPLVRVLQVPGRFDFAVSMESNDVEEIGAFLNESIKGTYERVLPRMNRCKVVRVPACGLHLCSSASRDTPALCTQNRLMHVERLS